MRIGAFELQEPLPELRFAERLDEPVRGRIRGVARPADVVLANQHRVDDQFGGRILHLETLWTRLGRAA